MKGKTGPKLPPAGRGNPPPPIMASMEQGASKMVGRLPDQGTFRRFFQRNENFGLEITFLKVNRFYNRQIVKMMNYETNCHKKHFLKVLIKNNLKMKNRKDLDRLVVDSVFHSNQVSFRNRFIGEIKQ